MAGCVGDEAGSGRSVEGNSSEYRSHFGDALAEWRSSEQLENGTPSTSPPYWDTDDNDGQKPSELYGKYTWKIEDFSKINKREHRSDEFEIGGYKWYILIYPQGCDVCNHLSLFLCVANHDKFLPGWSHSAQFTIAVVNKDPKKSKYSDTLHRFWKKEHDWGWKKFIELSKISDGFVDSDTLIIKAQVQVIREKTDRLFRCLDCQYRRELVRIYLMNVEQICRRFVEERIDKLVKLIDDKAQWSSFCAFWSGVDQNTRRRMSKEKSDMILKIIVKDLFVEKEVTSTLVMDSLYSGLRALEGQPKSKKGKAKVLEAEEIIAPMVGVEKDMFFLADDALLLLERAVLAPLPRKDDKGPQNRTKDGVHVEDFNKDFIERNEKRLTELGRRTIEVFVLTHIFSNKIEVAYQEAIALKMQEELIREEEAAWQAEGEQKAKRGATEKEKKSKKKQAKQKRNNRKEKDKGKDEKSNIALQVMNHQEAVDKKDLFENPDTLEDISDVSDSIDCVADSVDKDASHVNWETNTSEVLRPTEPSSNEISSLASVQSSKSESKSPSTMDDTSSTCSTDSVQSVVINGPHKGNSYKQYKIQNSLVREKDPHDKATCEGSNSANETERRTSDPVSDESPLSDESEAVVNSLQDRIKWLERHVVKKEEEVVSLQRKLSVKDQVDNEKPSKEKIKPAPSSRMSPSRNVPSTITSKTESKVNHAADPVHVMKSSSTNVPHRIEKSSPVVPKATENFVARQSPSMPRLSNAPTIPVLRPSTPVVSVAQTAPLVSRSVSATGWFDHNSTKETQTTVPQSYRNAMMGHSPIASTFSTGMLDSSQSSMLRNNLIASTFSTGVPDALQSRPHLMNRAYVNYNQRESLYVNDNQNMNVYKSRSLDRLSSDVPVCTSDRQCNGELLADDFPHIDIINDLLEDDHGVGNLAQPPNTMFHRPNNDTRFLNGQQFSSPSDMGMLGDFGPSANSCRFERTHSYHDSLREMLPQAHPRPLNYANSSHNIDGVIPNQWQVMGSDMSIFGMQNASYHNPEYSNVGFSDKGHAVFHPSNGRK